MLGTQIGSFPNDIFKAIAVNSDMIQKFDIVYQVFG
jgi:hypothetical protein